MTTGIYMLYFDNTDKVYVGQSKKIEIRYKAHCREMQNGTHTAKMNNAYKEYGLPHLEILEVCSEDKLNELEKYHITLWDAVTDGFNYMYIPAGGCMLGQENHKTMNLDSEIIGLVTFILANKELNLVEVSNKTNISYSTVKNISRGATYTWLEEVIPEQYNILMELNGTRNNIGENQGSSKYSNIQIAKAFNMIIDSPEIPNKDIASICEISESVVDSIGKPTHYLWLKEAYPDRYALLEEKLAEKRAYSRSAKARGIVYPPIKNPLDGSIHYIDNVNKFAKANGLDTGSLNKLLNGKAKSTKGWVVFKE